VMIHDGVRPIINRQLIEGSIELARAAGNAVVGIPAFETVALKPPGSDVVSSVVDRRQAYVLQAPQTFRLRDVFDLNQRAVAEGTIDRFVDQADMQAHFGRDLHLLPGLRGNVKITTPDDVAYFTYLVETGRYDRLISGEEAP